MTSVSDRIRYLTRPSGRGSPPLATASEVTWQTSALHGFGRHRVDAYRAALRCPHPQDPPLTLCRTRRCLLAVGGVGLRGYNAQMSFDNFRVIDHAKR
jgi:hypothetical protein